MTFGPYILSGTSFYRGFEELRRKKDITFLSPCLNNKTVRYNIGTIWTLLKHLFFIQLSISVVLQNYLYLFNCWYSILYFKIKVRQPSDSLFICTVLSVLLFHFPLNFTVSRKLWSWEEKKPRPLKYPMSETSQM